MSIRFEETLLAEISSDGQQTFRSGLLNRGKTKIVPM